MSMKSALRDCRYGSYSLIRILLTGSLRSPPLWWLRHHLSPASGGTTNRAKLRVTYEKIASRSFVLPPLAGEVPRSGQGGMHFLARRAVVWFFHGRSPVVKVLYKLAPSINLEAPPPPFEPSEPFEPGRRRRLNPQARQGLSLCHLCSLYPSSLRI